MRQKEQQHINDPMDYEYTHTLIYGNKLNVFSGSPE